MIRTLAAAVLAGLLFGGTGALAPVQAADAVSAAQMDANKKLVLEFYRTVFEPQNVNAAPNFMAENMIEHNPTAGQGLKGFQTAFGARWTQGPKPVEAALRSPPAVIMADGDLVNLIFKRPRPEPSDPSKTYDSYWFDAFRIQNGKIVEHWDGALKPTPPPAR